jgi:predicted flap endonuclease-1-like 5' DNA nuclease
MSAPDQTDHEVGEASRRLVAYYFYLNRIGKGIDGDAEDDWSAAGKHFVAAESSAPRVDALLGIVYPDRPENWDALTQIDGLDEDAEAFLNGRGIYRFAQIASWTPEVVAALGQFAQRVTESDWIGQARERVLGRPAAA